MKPLSEFRNPGVRFLFTDIDDTLTDHGRLGAPAYAALWSLVGRGIKVIPVTGRPAGWCEMIARVWPVDGVIGENGAFYFRYENKVMKRHFAVDERARLASRDKLDRVIAPEILSSVKGAAIASDQFSRISDLAIDFCEDVEPLETKDIDRIVKIFEKHGAVAKVSSIHVNGWFGNFDKLTMCKEYLKNEFGLMASAIQKEIAFVGDSPNDEPMFKFFNNSFAVANIARFSDRLTSKPAHVAPSKGGRGFCEVARALLEDAKT
ncbi:MAG TPA: HAD-IIB family hydrolase [Bdellovibrionales bacterium]|nr:HAD-IIB family hydrolase [Bdellovibrionales bacterium]